MQEHRDSGMVARLRYRLREQKLVIGYQLVRPDDAVRASLTTSSIACATTTAYEVGFLGVPDSGGSR